MFALDIILILVFIKLGITDSITKSRFNINLIWAVIFLASCGVGSSSNSTSNSLDVASSSQDIQIGNVPTIPTDNRSAGEYIIVPINNNINKSVTLGNMQLASNGAKTSTKLFKSYLDSSDCVQIPANSTCRLKVYTSQLANSYLLQMTFVDSSGRVHNATQVLSAHNQLPNINGFIYDASNLSLNDGLTNTLTIPFRLANNYSNISVLIDNNSYNVNCNNNNYTKGNLCEIVVNNNIFGTNTSTTHNLEILGYGTSNKIIARSNAMLSLTNSQKAHIITSGINMTINPDDGSNPQQVFLYNNGKVSATNLTISPTNPIRVSSNTCGSTLASGATCSFYVNVTESVTSGQSNVGISYSDSQNTQIFYFNVSYISPSYSPGLTMTTSGSFSNVIVGGAITYMGINIVNSGNTSLSNLKFTNINTQESSMSSFARGSTCYTGISLATSESCVMVLSFNPTSSVSGTINFIPVGTYIGQSGESLSYANSSLSIAYSTITYTGLIAVGDYGTTINSTSPTTPSTWTAIESSPFESSVTISNGVLNNSGTYVTTMSTGAVKYSTLNGLFWNIATATNFNSSTCQVVYDGTYYYTCGTAASTLDSCTVTGKGCIIRTNTLNGGTWSGLAQSDGSSIPINNIFYFVGTSNNGFVATKASVVANNGIMTSTNGTTWNDASSSQGSLTNNNFTCAVFNTATQEVVAWTSTALTSYANISSGAFGTAWIGNNSNKPASTSVNGAVVQNGLYSVATSLGNIYTATNITSAGSYTQVYTGATQLNAMAYGNGTYLAAGNNGVIVESATGSTWAAQTSYVVGQSTNPNIQWVTYDGTNFWIAGVNTMAKSPTTVPPVWTRPALTSITKNGSDYLAVDNQGFIYSSSNLTSWTQQTNPSSQVLNNIYCASTNLCFAVGESGTILKTTNGTSWTQLTSGTSASLMNITCQQSTCIVVGGSNTSSTGTVLTSTNYTNWTVQTSTLATTKLNSIAYYSGKYITVGASGTIFSSTTGSTWSSVSSPTANNLNSIACGNGCVAVGNSGTTIYTANGTSWNTISTTTSNNLNSVIYNGSFVTTGNAGTILYTQNPGAGWSTGTFPSTSSNLTNLYTIINN